jgi:glycosyltransferase involved in cell wall biosynthesis
MKAVIVDFDVSYPTTSGKRLRTLNLMLRLARRHQVTYIGRCPAENANTAQAEEFFRDHGITPVLVKHSLPRKAGLGFYARLGANVLSPLPYSVASHRSAPMNQAVRAHAASQSVDLWQFEWLPYMSTLAGVATTAPRVVVAHNVDTLIWHRYYITARDPLRRGFFWLQWRRTERFELATFRQASQVIAVSDEDARLIREKFHMPDVEVVDNGIDRAYFAAARGQRQPGQILFLGALDWRPNLDAVNLLLDSIFPAVLQRVPTARLCIVGRLPPPALVQRIASMAQVELHANVPDVRPFLAESTVMAVPLRIGGGSRLKILEALACGLPVVSTRVGAEGLRLRANMDFVQADEDNHAEALARVLQNPEPALEMARTGQQVVLEQYVWDVLADRQEQIWEDCLRRGSVACGAGR